MNNNKLENQNKLTPKQKFGVFAVGVLLPTILSGCGKPAKNETSQDQNFISNTETTSVKKHIETEEEKEQKIQKEQEKERKRIEEEKRIAEEKLQKKRNEDVKKLQEKLEIFKNQETPKDVIGDILDWKHLDKKTETIVGNGKLVEKDGKKSFEHNFSYKSEVFPEYSLIAVGLSTYIHSSPSRIANIDTAIEKLNGTIIPAQEIFSFLNSLGPVTLENGFVSGKVILDGKIKDALGGGTCQVSSTVFRALLNSGMTLNKYQPHSISYPSYYGKYGFDATVYSPSTDLKFENNSESPVILKVERHINNVVVLVYSKEQKNVLLKNTAHSVSEGMLYNRWKRKIVNQDGGEIRKGTFSVKQKLAH